MELSIEEAARRQAEIQYLTGLQEAIVRRHEILEALESVEDEGRATDVVIRLLGVDEVTAVAVLNLRVKDLLGAEVRQLQRRISALSDDQSV